MIFTIPKTHSNTHKTMKTKLCIILLLLLACIGSASLHSCIKPEDKIDNTYPCKADTAYYNLSDEQKKILPYTGYDTIRMASNMGDTIQCTGNGKQFFYELEFKPAANPACGNTGGEYIYHQAYKILFTDFKKNKTIEIAFGKENRTSAFLVSYIDVSIIFKGFGFYIFYDWISNSNSRTVYIGSKKVNNVTYSDVSKTNRNNSQNDTNSFALINKTQGLLQIQLNPTEIWTILN